VLEAVVRWQPQLDAVNAVTALNRIAKVAHGHEALDDPRFKVIVDWVYHVADARGIANSAWAMATVLRDD